MKNIVLLGATGSIGDSCLNVIRQNKEHFHLFGIGLGSNLDKAQQIAKEFSPEHIFIAESHLDKSHDLLQSHSNILNTENELQALIQDPSVDIVISAISGFDMHSRCNTFRYMFSTCPLFPLPESNQENEE